MKILAVFVGIAALMVGIADAGACGNNIHFHTTLQRTTHNLVQAEVVKMDNVVHNIGTGFSKSSGKFTAPEAGYYHFYMQLCTPFESNTGGELLLMQNGNRVLNLIARNPGSARHVQTSGATTVYCEKGDVLWLQTFHRGNAFRIHGNSFTNFGGYKLF